MIADRTLCLVCAERRAEVRAGHTLAAYDLHLDLVRRTVQVTTTGQLARVTERELRLLAYLVNRNGAVARYTDLEEILTSAAMDRFDLTNRLKVHAARVRRALRQAGSTVRITNLRSLGYRLDAGPAQGAERVSA